MDISNDKISMLLKNPELVGMIAKLAGGLSSQTTAQNQVPTENAAVEAVEATEALAVSENTEPMSAEPKPFAYADRRIALLNAIRPYVGESKRARVDGLVKAIGAAEVLSSYTGGLIGKTRHRG